MNNLLKSCPFCGAEGDITYNYDKKFSPYCINNDRFLNELDHGLKQSRKQSMRGTGGRMMPKYTVALVSIRR